MTVSLDLEQKGPEDTFTVEMLLPLARRGGRMQLLMLRRFLIHNLVWSAQHARFDPARAAAFAAVAELIEANLAVGGGAVTVEELPVPLAWLQTKLVGGVDGF